jgi:hypothetical protein
MWGRMENGINGRGSTGRNGISVDGGTLLTFRGRHGDSVIADQMAVVKSRTHDGEPKSP